MTRGPKPAYPIVLATDEAEQLRSLARAHLITCTKVPWLRANTPHHSDTNQSIDIMYTGLRLQ